MKIEPSCGSGSLAGVRKPWPWVCSSFHLICTQHVRKGSNGGLRPQTQCHPMAWQHRCTYHRVRLIFWNFRDYSPFIYSEIFIESQLCARHYFRHWGYGGEGDRPEHLPSWSSHSRAIKIFSISDILMISIPHVFIVFHNLRSMLMLISSFDPL